MLIRSISFENTRLEIPASHHKVGRGPSYSFFVGKNGSGKSRILTACADTLRQALAGKTRRSTTFAKVAGARDTRGSKYSGFQSRLFSDSSINLETDGGQIVASSDQSGTIKLATGKSSLAGLHKIIAASSSPFDRFPFASRNSGTSAKANEWLSSIKNSKYDYIGVRGAPFSSPSALLGGILESAASAALSDYESRRRISAIFRHVGYQPFIQVDYRLSDFFDFESIGESIELKIRRKISQASSPTPPDVVEELIQKGKDAYGRFTEVTDQIDSASLRFAIDIESGETYGKISNWLEGLALLRNLRLVRRRSVLLMKQDGSQATVDVSQASSGEQSLKLLLLGIATSIRENTLVFIDEPEVSLHPAWQQEFFKLIDSSFKSFDSCHFAIATHSPSILNQVDWTRSALFNLETGVVLTGDEMQAQSVDELLAEIFHAPGTGNEYLLRRALNALQVAVDSQRRPPSYREEVGKLKKFLDTLKDGDALRALIQSLPEE